MARAAKLIGDTPRERRAARTAARAECRGRKKALKMAIPAARAQLDASIAQARAELAERIAQMRSDFRARVKTMRTESSMRACVEMIAPAAPRRFGPKPPAREPEPRRRAAKRPKARGPRRTACGGSCQLEPSPQATRSAHSSSW